MHDHHQPRQGGSIALLALFVLVVFLLTLSALVLFSTSVGRTTRFGIDRTRTLARAEGTVEMAQRLMLSQISGFVPIADTGTVTIGGEIHDYTVMPVGDPRAVTAPDGVSSTMQRFRISAVAAGVESVARVERIVDLRQTPIFQYMIFYDDDLELLPGPDMLLEGRVHANGDLFVGSGNTLTVDSEYFHATGSILRRRKNDNSESTGTVMIKVTGEETYLPLTNDEDAEYEDWTLHALETWNGTVQDGSHGVSEVSPPGIGSLKAFQPDGTKGYYHENAGLVIVDGAAYDSAGNSVDLGGALSEKTMYDAREGKTITVTEVDIGLLNTSGHFPDNGLIYAYRTDASAEQPNGVRLVNGAEIASNLTVVTEDPIYVQGDFNNVNKKGVAVLADAVNLLSNGWSDEGGTMQSAEETWYNMAFVTGNVRTPDGGGPYSGGFENLPRFHENWSGVEAHIRGSFVNMFESEIATAPWGSPNVYSPPRRDWRFDPDLLTNLPPFTPLVSEIERLVWDDGLPSPLATP